MPNYSDYYPRPQNYGAPSGGRAYYGLGPYYSEDRGNSIRDLILQGGQAESQAALQKAKGWGDLLSGLGTSIAETYTAAQDAKKLAQAAAKQGKRDAAIAAEVEMWDKKDPTQLLAKLVKIAGPELGHKVATGVISFESIGREQDGRDMERGKMFAQVWPDMPIGMKERSWPAIREKVIKVFGVSPDQIQEEYKWNTPEAKAIDGYMMQVARSSEEKQKPITLGENQRLVDPRTSKVLVDAVPDQPKAAQAGSFEDFVKKSYGDNPTPEQILAGKQKYGQADDRVGGGGRGLTPNQESILISRLQGTWSKAVAPSREIKRQSAMMQAGLEAARRGDGAAGSQAVLVTFQKILDPTSVVRESEYARSAEGQALMARAKGAMERLQKGGAGVPVSELEKFATLANEISEKLGQEYIKQIRKQIGMTAKRYGIPDDLVLTDEFADTPQPEGPVRRQGAPPPMGTRRRFNPSTGRLE